MGRKTSRHLKAKTALAASFAALLFAGCPVSFNKDLYPVVSRNARFLPAPVITHTPVKPYYRTTESLSVTISCANPEGEIWYSLYGGAYTRYTGQITVSYEVTDTGVEWKTVRAYAKNPEYNDSPEARANYAFAPPGSVVDFAGTWTRGYTPTDDINSVPAYHAQYNAPSALELAPSVTGTPNPGSVYIADTGNNRIRRVDPDGYSYLVAGDGTPDYDAANDENVDATTVGLNAPTGLALSGDGQRLYVADTGNNIIRKIDFATAPPTITTVAGDGLSNTYNPLTDEGADATTVGLNAPTGMCLNTNEKLLYFSDSLNNRIRVIDFKASPPTITTVAGDGTTDYVATDENVDAKTVGLNAPAGLCLNQSSKLLYIAETGNNRIRMVDLKLTIPTIVTVAGGGTSPYDRIADENAAATTVSLSAPAGVCLVSNNGLLYIADTGNNCIRSVDLSTGTITTVTGGVQVNPWGEATKYHGNPGMVSEAVFYQPAAVLFNPVTLETYIADTGNNRVRKILDY